VGKEVILGAARRTLVEVGAAKLTVRAVSQLAGCSTTGIYTYFGNKQSLLDALFLEAFADFHKVVYGGEEPALLDSLARYRKWALSNPERYLLIFAWRASGYQPSMDALDASRASFEALVERVSADSRLANAARDAVAIAVHLWGTAHGYVMLELVGPGTLSADPNATFNAGMRSAVNASFVSAS
jgi:AcrR family transcriptional regulator